MPLELKIVVLFSAGVLGGMMNSLAGGGTLVTFPALMSVGLPAVTANITSTVALILGLVSSLWSYRRELTKQEKWAWRFAIPSLAGGLVGALLLLNTGEAQFRAIVPYLILGAAALFTFQKPLVRLFEIEANAIESSSYGIALALLFQFAVAVYGGYFGAGIGILMLAALGILGHTDIHQMNSLKTLQAFLINIVAVGCFVVAGDVRWPEAAMVASGAAVGGGLGPYLGRWLGAQAVRAFVSLVGFTIGAYYLFS